MFKRRWRIFRGGLEYPTHTQVDIVYALTAVHNWIIDYSGLELAEVEDLVPNEGNDYSGVRSSSYGETDSSTIGRRREAIALQMWIEYQRYLGEKETREARGEENY